MSQGKVDAFYLEYIEHTNVNAIIPDTLIHNYKDDKGSSRPACLPAIINVKTRWVD